MKEKIKCSICGKVIQEHQNVNYITTDNEIPDAICENCIEIQNEKSYYEKRVVKENVYSKTFRIIGIITLLIGFIVGFILGVDEYGDLSFNIIVVWFDFGVIAFGAFLSSEIIQILHDIRLKLWKDKK